MNHSGAGVRLGVYLAAVFAGAASAAAQPEAVISRPPQTADAMLNAENQSWPRYLQRLLLPPEWIDLAVDQRTRFEYLENPFRPGEPDSQAQFPQRTRLRLGIDVPQSVRFLVEFQDSRTWNDGPDDFTRNVINHVDLLQLSVSATSHDLFGSDLRGDVHFGRLTLDVGSRRLVARNRFRNTTNAFDGVHLQIAGSGELWRLRGFYTRPVQREDGAFDDAAWSGARFWGLAYEDLRTDWMRIDMAYFDLDSEGTATRLHTVDLRVHRPSASGELDYELELIGQFGDVGALDQSAFATHAELGYTFDLPWSPQVAAQYDYASGTGNPGGDDNHTFVPLFGARRFDLMPTGIFGPFVRSNISSPGLRIGLVPLPDLRVDLKLRYWQLAEAEGAFVGGGVQDPTGDAGRSLGTDLELRLRWDPTPWLGVALGYDYWFKGSYLDAAPNVSSTDNSNYLYGGARFRF